MTDGEALLRGVLADPFCNVPRLVYADWLEENGEPERAEYIRACINLDRYEFNEWLTERGDAVLGRANPGEARPNLIKWFSNAVGFQHERFDGGFASKVRFYHMHDFIDHCESLFNCQPITKVNVHHTFPIDFPYLNTVKPDNTVKSNGFWFVMRPIVYGSHYSLPQDIFNEMEFTWFNMPQGTSEFVHFKTYADGKEALSRTLVNYARVRVGLERLKFPAYA